MQVAIIDYNAGNTRSVQFAFQRLGAEAIVTADPEVLQRADRVLFPGVGHAASAMGNLKKNGLDQVIKSLKQPVLGICLGLQLMCSASQEGGKVDCLDIFPIQVKKFPVKKGLKVPHMGWNTCKHLSSPLLGGLSESSAFYFVHSYYAETHPEFTIARGDYIEPFSAVLHRDNFWAAQFHPEKSAATGQKLLENFLKI